MIIILTFVILMLSVVVFSGLVIGFIAFSGSVLPKEQTILKDKFLHSSRGRTFIGVLTVLFLFLAEGSFFYFLNLL
ncbi:hypothetical protein [Arcticibacter tournemirensis]